MISKYINRLLLFTIFFICSSVSIFLQDLNAQDKTEEETFKHNHVILSIGHSVIPSGVESGEFNKLLYVPIWGLSYEYGFTEKFHVGIKGEMEISNYIITDADGSELERENPASLSLLFFISSTKI